VSREGFYDFDKLGKALARKGNAKLQQGNHDEAIELFNSSLLEKNDPAVKHMMK
jgi:stress-induced-phosphoprotein 1